MRGELDLVFVDYSVKYSTANQRATRTKLK
jgi:hypothetical protein